MQEILVSNEASTLTDAEAQVGVAAVQAQLDRDFAPAYSGLTARLKFLPKGQAVPKGVEIIHLLDNSDQAGALGYHELNPAGYAEGFVFVKTTRDAGDPWTTCFGHEVLEQVLDPMANWAAQAHMGRAVVWIALENCDAVESDRYPINGVPVSNFVLPNWFTGASGKVDFLGKLKRGLTLDAGGYIAYADSKGNWHQKTGQRAKEPKYGAPAFGRKARYMLQTHQAARGLPRRASMGLGDWLAVLSKALQVAPQVLQEVQAIVKLIGTVLPAPAPSGELTSGPSS